MLQRGEILGMPREDATDDLGGGGGGTDLARPVLIGLIQAPAVVDEQLGYGIGSQTFTRIDASRPLDEVAADCLRQIATAAS